MPRVSIPGAVGGLPCASELFFPCLHICMTVNELCGRVKRAAACRWLRQLLTRHRCA